MGHPLAGSCVALNIIRSIDHDQPQKKFQISLARFWIVILYCQSIKPLAFEIHPFTFVGHFIAEPARSAESSRDHRVPFSATGSARSACMSARAGLAFHSLGPIASPTARPSRPMRKVVGKPMTP